MPTTQTRLDRTDPPDPPPVATGTMPPKSSDDYTRFEPPPFPWLTLVIIVIVLCGFVALRFILGV